MCEVIIYTDGACSGNGQANNGGAFFSVITAVSKDKVLAAKAVRGVCPNTTNNRMELLGVVEALKLLKPQGSLNVKVVTDSTYVAKHDPETVKLGMTKAKRPIKNAELWNELYRIMSDKGLVVTFEHVDGHAGNFANEYCDAKAALLAAWERTTQHSAKVEFKEMTGKDLENFVAGLN